MTGISTDELLAVAALWKKSHRELVAAFGGTSMTPTIAAGQSLTVRCDEEGKLGDVVIIANDGSPIVHRIVAAAANGAWLLTRGDANVVPDMPVCDSNHVIGRVVAVDGQPLAAVKPTVLQGIVLRLCVFVLANWLSGGRTLIRLLIATRRRAISVLIGLQQPKT